MKQTLSDDCRHRLDALIADTEKQTNAQIVLSVIQRSDSYEELPWKAFALGASMTSLLVFMLDLFSPSWKPSLAVLITVAVTLTGGTVFALLTVLIPEFARQFLSAFRAEVEVHQYAESQFLSHELFATSERRGVLILVSLFERQVAILPDKGLRNQLTKDATQSIIAAMSPFLKGKEIGQAFEAGLKRLAYTLGTNVLGAGDNELSNEIIEEKGV